MFKNGKKVHAYTQNNKILHSSQYFKVNYVNYMLSISIHILPVQNPASRRQKISYFCYWFDFHHLLWFCYKTIVCINYWLIYLQYIFDGSWSSVDAKVKFPVQPTREPERRRNQYLECSGKITFWNQLDHRTLISPSHYFRDRSLHQLDIHFFIK